MSLEPRPAFAGPYGQLTPRHGGDPIPLMKKRLLVGRKGESDIQLKFNNVSSQHCRLTLEHGYWFVRDLNSRNGIKVNRKCVLRKRIDPGDELSIARHAYIVEYDPMALGASGPPPVDDDCMVKMMRSSLLSPCDGGEPIPLHKRVMLIGRGPEADILLDFDDISQSHCRLTTNANYWYAYDLTSGFGIKVNGLCRERSRVDPGDVLSFADHHYIIVYDPPQERDLVDEPPPGDNDEIDAMMRESQNGTTSRPRHRR